MALPDDFDKELNRIDVAADMIPLIETLKKIQRKSVMDKDLYSKHSDRNEHLQEMLEEQTILTKKWSTAAVAGWVLFLGTIIIWLSDGGDAWFKQVV